MIRTLIVDEVRLMCNIVATTLQAEDDIEVTACATSVEEAFENLEGCDIILVSTTLPDDGALRIIQETARANLPAKVIAVGLPNSIDHIMSYTQCGAAGFVLRDDQVDALLDQIRAVHAGQALVSPDFAAALMERVAQLADYCQDAEVDVSYDLTDLTSRELEVLNHIGRGLSNQEIADRLFIQVGTAKNHVHNILKKLDVNSREEAASYLSRLSSSRAA
jgi:DNA-binding NarL/FixJ family response regulator